MSVPAEDSVSDIEYVPSLAVVAVVAVVVPFLCSVIVWPATPAPVSFRVSLPVIANGVPITAFVGPLIVSVVPIVAALTVTESVLLVDGFNVVTIPPPVKFNPFRYVHTGCMYVSSWPHESAMRLLNGPEVPFNVGKIVARIVFCCAVVQAVPTGALCVSVFSHHWHA